MTSLPADCYHSSMHFLLLDHSPVTGLLSFTMAMLHAQTLVRPEVWQKGEEHEEVQCYLQSPCE